MTRGEVVGGSGCFDAHRCGRTSSTHQIVGASMHRPSAHRLRLTACALATALVVGCGGGSGNSPTALQSQSVQMSDSLSRVTVTAAGTSSDGSRVSTMQWAAMQYAFSAAVSGGAHAGQTVAGTLLLTGETEGGSTEVEGRLLVGTAAAPAPTASATTTQAQTLTADFNAKMDALRAKLRSDIDALRQKLRSDLAAATSAAQLDAAKQAFT